MVDEGLLAVRALVPHLPGVRGLVLHQLVAPDEGLVAGLTLVRPLVQVVAPHVLVELVLPVVCLATEVTSKVSGQGLLVMNSVDMVVKITTEVGRVITAIIGARLPKSWFPRPSARAPVVMSVHQVMGRE